MSTSGEGWFADPQDARRLRWWDGTRWTEHTHPMPYQGAARHQPLGQGWRWLASMVQLSLLGCVATAAFVLYTDVAILDFVEEITLRPEGVGYEDGARIDRLMILSLVDVAALLVTGTLFVAWHYQLHDSARMDRTALRHRTGWTVGGWLVPFLSFWRPFQMMTDVRRGLTGDTDTRASRVQGWWWGCFVGSLVLAQVAGVFYRLAADTADDDVGGYVDLIATAARWERWSAGLSMVAALLALAMVRHLTSRALREPGAGDT